MSRRGEAEEGITSNQVGDEDKHLHTKRIYTEADFDSILWHDCSIHAIAFNPQAFEFMIDMDHIAEWIAPSPGEQYYNFTIAPATLVFSNAHSINIDINPQFLELQIDNVTREKLGPPRNAEYVQSDVEWRWTIYCQEGVIDLQAIGYQLILRSAPVNIGSEDFTLAERGGISFATIPY